MALKPREIFPCENKSRVYQLVDDGFLDDLCNSVTEGLKGDVGVIPRQFLRELITVPDLVEEHDGADGGKEYVPRDVYTRDVYNFSLEGLSEEEQSFVDGKSLSDIDDNGGDGYDVEPLE